MNRPSDMAKASIITITAEIDLRTGKPKTTAPALLTASADVPSGVEPLWTVTHTGDPNGYTPTPTVPSGQIVQFQANSAGTWTFSVEFKSGGSLGSESITLGNPTGNIVFYRFRALPSESTGLPLTEIKAPVQGGAPSAINIAVSTGTPINGQMKVGGVGTPGEVRFIGSGDLDAVTTTNSLGAFTLGIRAAGTYTPLLIPSAPTLAPHLGTPLPGTVLATASFDVTAGETVTGSVTDGTNNLAGVAAVLRAKQLPSGSGKSNAAGAFSLHAEKGTYNTLSFGSDDWPQASCAGVVIPQGGTTLAIQYNVARVAVGGSVVASDGTTPLANARVTITSRPLGTVASVSVGGGAPLAASGRVSRVVTTNASGALPAMMLPGGTYDLIVEPPFGSNDGLTAITKVVGGASTWTLQVLPPITLQGQILGDKGQVVPNARVTAVEMVGLGAAPSATTDANGKYKIVNVDRGAPVTLLVEPDAAAHQSGTRVALAAGTTSADVVLGPGLKIEGLVKGPSNQALVATEVDALCDSCGSDIPIATSITNGNGIYSIYLPDPGEFGDGGVN